MGRVWKEEMKETPAYTRETKETESGVKWG